MTSPTPDDLAAELLDLVLEAEPVAASLLGIPGHDDRLADLSLDAQHAVVARFADLAARADAVPDGDLGEQDRQTLGFVRHVATVQHDSVALGAVEWTVTDLFIAPVPALVDLLPRVTLDSPARAAGFLARLEQVPGHLRTLSERHALGVASGRVPVARLVQAAVDHVQRVLDGDVAELRVEAQPSAGVGDEFAVRRDELLDSAVRPALEDYRDALVGEILPAGRDDEHPGLCHLPDGDATYAVLVREHTSTGRTPDELHETGLALAEGLRAEYAEVGARVFGSGDLAEVFTHLRDDPDLAWSDADEMLDAARAAVARAEEAASGWFGTVPDQQCLVEAVPESAAPGAPPAYYLPGSLDGARRGTYFLNTHEPTERRRYSAEAVAFHEAVPGHHFQITTAQHLDALPMVRRVLVDTAFAEGWGLYCERLADEMGLYSGDVARLGMLAADSWRAARLVVDTGLHARGWSRQRAVDWMTAHTPMAPIEVESEVDRYIAYPGQALSYMVGRQELLALRARATDSLGDAFDVKAFHDLVLGTGGLPLRVLADAVDRWVAARS